MRSDTDGLLEEVAPHLYLVRAENAGRFPFSYPVLATGETNVLFDTGGGVRVMERLRDELPVDLVVNSHTHPDHFSGNHCFRGRELLVPEMFAGILDDLDRMSVRLAGGGEPSAQWLFFVKEILQHQATPPTSTYVEGHVVQAGDYSFEAIHAPGHTADSYCFFDREKRVLLSFDYDLTDFGPWYGHRESDLRQTRDSIERLIALEPAVVISSHRRPVTEGIEEAFRRYDRIVDERTSVILELLEEGPATPETLADRSPIYGMRQAFALYHYFESRLIEKHLEVMVDEGQVAKGPDDLYRVW